MTTIADETELVPTKCAKCGASIMVEVPIDPDARKLVSGLLARVACEGCTEIAGARKIEQTRTASQMERLSQWRQLCPDEFKKPIDFKLCSKKLHAAIMAWEFGTRGLIATGRTGRCKTRFMFKLCEREFYAGRSLAYVRHSDFREKVSRFAYEDAGKLYRYLRPLREVDIVFFDDLGKGRFTDATEEAFESLLDFRTRGGKPILFTTNDGSESLQARLSADRGEPIIRRIFDFCEPIDFGFE